MMKKVCLLLSLGFVYAPAFAGMGREEKKARKILGLKKKEDNPGRVVMTENNVFTMYSNERWSAIVIKETGNLTAEVDGIIQSSDADKTIVLCALINAYKRQNEEEVDESEEFLTCLLKKSPRVE